MIALLFLIILVMYLLPTYPKPIIIENFLSEEERTHIMTEAKSKLQVSTVAKDRTVDESIPMDNCEKLQVLRYQPGGFYNPHQDAFMDDKNKRLYTFVLALNDDYEGGETTFPNLEEKYRMRAGDALFFNTLDNYELDTSKALHGGEPVKNGEKWICNLWVRKYPYN